MRIPIFLSAFLFAALGAGGIAVAQSDNDWAYDSCVAAHEACIAGCREANDDGKSGAGCLVGCATKEVECATGQAASKVKPWLQRKTDELKNFLDDFLKDMPDWEPSPPPPSDDGDFDTT